MRVILFLQLRQGHLARGAKVLDVRGCPDGSWHPQRRSSLRPAKADRPPDVQEDPAADRRRRLKRLRRVARCRSNRASNFSLPRVSRTPNLKLFVFDCFAVRLNKKVIKMTSRSKKRFVFEIEGDCELYLGYFADDSLNGGCIKVPLSTFVTVFVVRIMERMDGSVLPNVRIFLKPEVFTDNGSTAVSLGKSCLEGATILTSGDLCREKLVSCCVLPAILFPAQQLCVTGICSGEPGVTLFSLPHTLTSNRRRALGGQEKVLKN